MRAAFTKKELETLEADLGKRILKEVSLVTTLPLGLICNDKSTAPQYASASILLFLSADYLPASPRCPSRFCGWCSTVSSGCTATPGLSLRVPSMVFSSLVSEMMSRPHLRICRQMLTIHIPLFNYIAFPSVPVAHFCQSFSRTWLLQPLNSSPRHALTILCFVDSEEIACRAASERYIYIIAQIKDLYSCNVNHTAKMLQSGGGIYYTRYQ
jgi:hypothetical protein